MPLGSEVLAGCPAVREMERDLEGGCERPKERPMLKRLVLLLASILLVTGLALADTVTGVVSDAMCGVKHLKSTAEDQGCVKRCGDVGEELMVVGPGYKMYRTENQAKLKGFEGKRVKVTGKFEPMGKDMVMTITSVELAPADSDSKDGGQGSK
jgi:hypothetical protein